MARPKSVLPQMRVHLSGQGFVRIDDRNFYLGKHGSPESLARYAVLIAEYQANQLMLPKDFDVRAIDERAGLLLASSVELPAEHLENMPILVKHLTTSYRKFAKQRYANSEAELPRILSVCGELEREDGSLLAVEYGPKALKRQRQRWVDSGKSRLYCNRLTNLVIRMYKWASSEELVDESAWNWLKSLEPLKVGHTDAPESEPIRPVAIADVVKTIPQLPPVIRAMVRVQVATGMRPSELCGMRPAEIDRSGPVWMYRPAMHKNAGKGKTRAIPIVGDAREAITEFLNRSPQHYCFSPAESMAWISAKRRSERRSKVQPSHQNRKRDKPQVSPGECYDKHSYRRAIDRAAKRAGVKPWFPYQIRHLAGTFVREALGPEAAQALLGHSHISMTEHYAKVSERKAIEAANAAPKLNLKS